MMSKLNGKAKLLRGSLEGGEYEQNGLITLVFYWEKTLIKEGKKLDD
jgi:hypothetical protein